MNRPDISYREKEGKGGCKFLLMVITHNLSLQYTSDRVAYAYRMHLFLAREDSETQPMVTTLFSQFSTLLHYVQPPPD